MIINLHVSYIPINPSWEGDTISKAVLVFYFLNVLRIFFLAYNWAKLLLTQSDSVWECGHAGPHLCIHSWGRVFCQHDGMWHRKHHDGVFWATQNTEGPYWLPLSLIVRLTAAAQHGWKASSQTPPNAGSYNAKRRMVPTECSPLCTTLIVNSSKLTWNSQSSWLI